MTLDDLERPIYRPTHSCIKDAFHRAHRETHTLSQHPHPHPQHKFLAMPVSEGVCICQISSYFLSFYAAAMRSTRTALICNGSSRQVKYPFIYFSPSLTGLCVNLGLLELYS